MTTYHNVNNPNQRKTWYAAGRYWVVYSDGSNLVYRSSIDGVNWGNSSLVKSSYYYAYYLSVAIVDTYVYYVIATGGTTMFYRRGVCGSDGVISWSTERYISGFTSVNSATIAVDSDGHAYIGFCSNSLPYVTKNANTDDTWSTASGFPHQLSATSGSLKVTVAALDGGSWLRSTRWMVRSSAWFGSTV